MTDEVKALVERCKGHTPGPWRVDGPPHNQIVWNGPESRICFMAHSNGVDNERDIATGNLVAAAPELLDLIETQAREIERLNAILSELNDTDVIARTMAENERLRAAGLTDVELEEALTAVGIGVYGPDAERFEKMFAAAMTARAALAGDNHDQ